MRGPDESKPTCEFHVGLLSEDDGFSGDVARDGTWENEGCILALSPVVGTSCASVGMLHSEASTGGGGGAQMCNRRNLRFEPICSAEHTQSLRPSWRRCGLSWTRC